MATKDWINQTSNFQKSIGGLQYINKKNNTQISIGKWDFSKAPKNYQFNVSSVSEARKGYPNQRLGITKTQALKKLRSYMRKN